MDRYPETAVVYELDGDTLLEIIKGIVTGRFEKGMIQRNGIASIRGNDKASLGDGVLDFLKAEEKKIIATASKKLKAGKVKEAKDEKTRAEREKREKKIKEEAEKEVQKAEEKKGSKLTGKERETAIAKALKEGKTGKK